VRDWIEVRDSYYKLLNGKCLHVRHIDGVRQEPEECSYMPWFELSSVWITVIRRPVALVKEGPKALIHVAR
jgi:hypothetical protein